MTNNGDNAGYVTKSINVLILYLPSCLLLFYSEQVLKFFVLLRAQTLKLHDLVQFPGPGKYNFLGSLPNSSAS